MGIFPGANFPIRWWESEKEWFWPLKPFSKLKTTLCKHWTLIKIKITWVHKKYEDKIKMVWEQWLQLKMKFFFWAITWELLFSGGCAFGGVIKIWWGKSTGGTFLGGGGMSKFLTSGGWTSPIPQYRKPCCLPQKCEKF